MISHVAGCSIPVRQHDWSTYEGPGAAYFHEPQYELPFHEDPLEPINRVFVGVNAAVVVGLAEPVASGWRSLVPQDVRTPLVRAADNLEYPRRGLNHLLQGNAQKAGDETARFGINTTLGVLGLSDAAAKQGLKAADTDTGTTLWEAGWKNSVYLTLPLGMPGTARDVVGGVGDTLLDPTIYFFPAAPIKGCIQAAERLDGIERFLTTNQDPYEPMRRMYQARREAEPIEPLESATAGPALETLGYAMLSPRDAGFDLRDRGRRVRIATTGKSLPYDIWMQSAPAPLVMLLPGFGGHRESYQNIAIAEMFYNAGYSVATISSTANFEFMRHAATAIYPGYLPADAADVARAIAAISRDLAREYGHRIQQRALVGVSFGGCHALYIGAHDSKNSNDPGFDAYLAICPPVQFEHAANMLDTYYNLPLTFPEDKRDAHVAAIMKKGARLTFAGPAARPSAGLTEDEAAFLVGLSYRLSLHDVIWVSRERHETEILETEWNPFQRASASQEILGYSLMKYAYAFLLPALLDALAIEEPDDMTRQSDLRRLEGLFRTHRNIGVAFNEDDFLLAPGDSGWMRRVFGEQRLAISENGGHMGNLGEDTRRAQIVDLLDHLLSNREGEPAGG